MADTKFDLLNNTLSLKTIDGLCIAKELLTSESSIPLSPQWLYAKPVDAKASTSGASGELRAPNSLPCGSFTNPNTKESWRLDGSQDKMEWRRTGPVVKSSRRWQEEERETGFLGRRDHRKDDRRSDVISTRETAKNSVLLSSDPRLDMNNRSSVRENKWSSRWGPEEKEKDSQAEKKTDFEKEDTHNDKHSTLGGNQVDIERETDSHDKWRPRHRMEVQVGGSAAYRTAPGYGLERGLEGSNVGFAPGRGRPNYDVKSPIGWPPSPSVTSSVSVYNIAGKTGFSANSCCYPRGKLLDIHRNPQTGLTFGAKPDRMEQVSSITQEVSTEPLAFVAPDREEEDVLGDIWKGKITSSEVPQNSYRDKNGGSNNNVEGINDVTSSERKISSSTITEEAGESSERASVTSCLKDSRSVKEGEQKFATVVDEVLTKGLLPIFRESSGCSRAKDIGGTGDTVTELKDSEDNKSAYAVLLNKLGENKLASTEFGCQLPDDTNSLFGSQPLQPITSSYQYHLKSNDEANLLERVVLTEKLRFCYLDPQGVIQGPFLGSDIIAWFKQGFFGTDLPVRLSDAPDGSTFQDLGELVPHLRGKSCPVSGSNLFSKLDLSEAIGGGVEKSIPTFGSTPHFNEPTFINVHQRTSSGFESISNVNVQSIVPNHGYQNVLQNSNDQSFTNFVAGDDGIVFPGRHGDSNGDTMFKPFGHGSFSNSTICPSLANEFSEMCMPIYQDGEFHPFGVMMSELRGGSGMRHAQSTDRASSISDHSHFINPLVERNACFTSEGSHSAMIDHPFSGTRSDDYRTNTLSNPNIGLGSIYDIPRPLVEQEFNGCDLAEHLMLQKLQKEQLLQNCSFSKVSGLQYADVAVSPATKFNLQKLAVRPVSNLEHLWELQFRQQCLLDSRHQLQQQFRHQQMKVQLEQQFLLEQLLCDHMFDYGYVQAKIDPMRDNLIEEVRLKNQLLHDVRQSSLTSRHLNPSLEQIIQSNIGQSALRGEQTNFLDLMQTKHGNMLLSEHQLFLQPEELQAHHLSNTLRQPSGFVGERHNVEPRPVDEVGYFLRNPAGHLQAQLAGFNNPDFYDQKQRFSSCDEQLSHLWRNNGVPKNQREFYEPSSMYIERSNCLPGNDLGMKFDNINTFGQGLDIHLHKDSGDFVSFSSAIPSHHQQDSEIDYHPNTIQNYSSGNNGHLENILMEAQKQHMRHEAERSRQDTDTVLTSRDTSSWLSARGDDDISKQFLMELKKLGYQSPQSLEVASQHPISSSERESISFASSDERGQDFKAGIETQAAEKKDMHFGKTSDGGVQAARGGKKKGKKGRPIDPALLGFKVSSKRDDFEGRED